MTVPAQPKIYHIVHVDRLPSIISDGNIWCDAEIVQRTLPGTTIGMNANSGGSLSLPWTAELHVGDCVPFYFCPRSIMLYLIYQGNHPELDYTGGQGHIIHLETDLYTATQWATQNNKRWAFTLSNAGARYFEDRCDLAQLNEINWDAVQANQWGGRDVSPSVKEGKQAEFLIEHSLPWHLVERIGVRSRAIYQQSANAISADDHRPQIQIKNEWYY